MLREKAVNDSGVTRTFAMSAITVVITDNKQIPRALRCCSGQAQFGKNLPAP